MADLTAPDGLLVVTLRHGPPPPERRMFDVPAGETVELAARCGFALVQQGAGADQLGRDEVHWSELALRRERA